MVQSDEDPISVEAADNTNSSYPMSQ
ncbi:unnamed protein product, partial [Rotaria magnacalcarata]